MNKEMRFLIDESLLKRYKLVCIENDLSIPKQTKELIRKFVEVFESDMNRIKESKKGK